MEANQKKKKTGELKRNGKDPQKKKSIAGRPERSTSECVYKSGLIPTLGICDFSHSIQWIFCSSAFRFSRLFVSRRTIRNQMEFCNLLYKTN